MITMGITTIITLITNSFCSMILQFLNLIK